MGKQKGKKQERKKQDGANQESRKELLEKEQEQIDNLIKEYGQVILDDNEKEARIFLLSIIGEIE